MKLMKLLPLLVIGMLIFQSCNRTEQEETSANLVKSFDNKVLHDWSELFLRIDKDALGFRPTPGPRALAYINWATYEACVPGMPEYNSLKNLPQFVEANIPDFDTKQTMYWPEVVNEVQSYLMSKMFEKVDFFKSDKGSHLTNAEVQQLIQNLKIGNEKEFLTKTNTVTFTNSKAWGESVARAVWNWSTTDKWGHEAYLNVLSNDPAKGQFYDWRKFSLDAQGNRLPGRWTPTNDNPDGGMFPYAGKWRTFANFESNKICRAPMSYDDKPGSRYFVENEEVYNRAFTNLTFDEEYVGQFWSDDLFGLTFSPPSRLLSCLDQIMVNDNSKLDKAIYATALLCLALNDFGVCCWNSKFYYNVERPEHFIKDVMKHPEYEPPLDHPYTGVKGITPAFPAYPSGHSTFGGGGFYAIAQVYGNNTRFTDRCHEGRTEFYGAPKTYNTLSEAGTEEALSRVPLGVHIRQDCVEGIRYGIEIASRVAALPWKK